MINSFWDDVKLWARKPYDPNGDIMDWFLFIGLLLAIIFMWSRVIKLVFMEIKIK